MTEKKTTGTDIATDLATGMIADVAKSLYIKYILELEPHHFIAVEGETIPPQLDTRFERIFNKVWNVYALLTGMPDSQALHAAMWRKMNEK